jgi:2'-5' RNA ligase
VRLFVAVEPSPAAREHLDAALAALRETAPTGLRWVPRDRWHVTLAFLGDVGDNVLSDLRTRLERAARRHPPMELCLARGGRFDGRVLWVGMGGDVEPLRALAASVQAGARRAGCAIEERRWRAHLTLARARTPIELRDLAGALGAYAGPSWEAGELALVRSHLGAQVRYETVGAWPLGVGA